MRTRASVPSESFTGQDKTEPETYEYFSSYILLLVFLIECTINISQLLGLYVSRKSIEITSYDEENPFSNQYTNYTIGFKDCLDYIFYDENSFSVEQVGFS